MESPTMEIKKFKEVKVIFQQANGFWPVADDKLLNDEDFEKLLHISSNSWILIVYPNKVRGYPTTNNLNLESLKEATLRKIADEKELSNEDVDDIIKNIKHEGN